VKSWAVGCQVGLQVEILVADAVNLVADSLVADTLTLAEWQV